MDSNSFHFHNIKVEKAKKTLKYRRLQKVTALFRLIEACLFLIIVAMSSPNLIFPLFAFKISGEYIKGLFISLTSPGSVFIIGNLIVIILFLKSGHSSSSSSSAQEAFNTNNNKVDLYDEYVQSCQRNHIVRVAETKKSISAAKEVIDEGDNKDSLKEKRSMRRSRSENQMNKVHKREPKRPEMKRSVTEKCLKSVENRGLEMVKSHPVDGMSNEEFRSRVEAFIARQQRILREEVEI